MPRSLLVISAVPDDRPSTSTLVAFVDELRRRPDVRAQLWFLRDGDGGGGSAEGDADRVVDDLRRNRLATLLESAGLGRLAGVLRGRLLRRWWNHAAPDAVVLDDGLGARVLAGRSVTTVVRTNERPPADAALEDGPLASADLWIVSDGSAEEHRGSEVVPVPPVLKDLHSSVAYCESDERDRVRRRLGLPERQPLVLGWGADPWLDGVDVFVRALWILEHVHGVVAHGAWIGCEAIEDDTDRLMSEVRRCALDGRVSFLADGDAEARFCGDVVLLPHRSVDPELAPLDEVLVTGAQVVCSTASRLEGTGITVVADLDASAAGAALARCLADDRGRVAAHVGRAYHVGPWVDDLLDALERIA